MSISVELVEALKRSLRAQQITYRELARRLDLSEAAVKRMFSLRAMSLKRIEEVCQVLDLGLAELAADAARGREPMSQLSEAQEQALVDQPELLVALFLVLNRWSMQDVQAHFSFDEPQWVRLLARLDRLGIIEMQPGNRGRPRISRNVRWRRNGPMERHFRHHLLGEYFADPFDGEQDALYLLSGALSVEGVRLLRERLQELVREFDALLLRDATLSPQSKVGVSLVLAQKPWLLPSFDVFRRRDGVREAVD